MSLGTGALPLHGTAHTPGSRRLSVSAIQNTALALFVFLGFLAIVEPSPYEVMFLITGFVFCVTGLRMAATFVPLVILLLLFNIGGAFSLIPFITERDAFTFVAISFYMGVTAVFYAAVLLDQTLERMIIIRNAWVAAGVIAALAGMAGYFDIAGTASIFTLYGRASGTFKDPNVFGPFVAGPAILLIERYFIGDLKRPVLTLVPLLILLGGVFFSFSRGAWGVLVFGTILTGLLIVLTCGSRRIHARIFTTAVIGSILLTVLLAVILSVPQIHNLFMQRFSLTQDYDVGAQGRFGKVGSAITLLLDRPNGLGPLRFDNYFPEAPHDVYINAFSAYGWLGGITYIALIGTTMWLGWSTVWKRTPWQHLYIAYWSLAFFQMLQGFQIDTDHWRHLWLLIGVAWGGAVASWRYERRRRGLPAA